MPPLPGLDLKGSEGVSSDLPVLMNSPSQVKDQGFRMCFDGWENHSYWCIASAGPCTFPVAEAWEEESLGL